VTVGAGTGGSTALDVSEIAWTPEHFERQRRFLIEAILPRRPGLATAGRSNAGLDDRRSPRNLCRLAGDGSGQQRINRLKYQT